MAIDYKALARAKYDPLTENGMYRQEKSRLRKAMADSYAAQFARYGSLADQNDPNRAGSLISEDLPGLFGRYSPNAQQGLAQGGPDSEPPLMGMPQQGLRRKEDKTPFSLDDLSDEDFLQSLGLNLGLRRGAV